MFCKAGAAPRNHRCADEGWWHTGTVRGYATSQARSSSQARHYATKHRAFRARKRARNAIRDEMPTEEGRRIEKYVKARFDRVAAESSRDEIRDDEEAHANAVIQALIEEAWL
jgi:hypothetical protein